MESNQNQLTIGGQTFDTKASLAILDVADEIIASISPDLTFEYAMRLLGTLGIHILNTYAAAHPEAKEQMYYAYNFMASNVLAAFIPEDKLRPDLTAEAIVKAENELIEEKYSQINRENRRKAKKEINKVKRYYAKKVQQMSEVRSADDQDPESAGRTQH